VKRASHHPRVNFKLGVLTWLFGDANSKNLIKFSKFSKPSFFEKSKYANPYAQRELRHEFKML